MPGETSMLLKSLLLVVSCLLQLCLPAPSAHLFRL